MSERDDGGPAFPGMLTKAGMLATHEEAPRGMSLRDWLAGQALASIGTWTPMSGAYVDLSGPSALKSRAEWAYAQADAMLEARKECPLSLRF